MEGNTTCVELLLSTHGIVVNIKGMVSESNCYITMYYHVHVHLYPHVDYPHQYGYTPLHLAARKGNITCVERLLCTPGIDVNIRAGRVSQSIESS